MSTSVISELQTIYFIYWCLSVQRHNMLKVEQNPWARYIFKIYNSNNYLAFITEGLDVFDCNLAKHFQPFKQFSLVIRSAGKWQGTQGSKSLVLLIEVSKPIVRLRYHIFCLFRARLSSEYNFFSEEIESFSKFKGQCRYLALKVKFTALHYTLKVSVYCMMLPLFWSPCPR